MYIETDPPSEICKGCNQMMEYVYTENGCRTYRCKNPRCPLKKEGLVAGVCVVDIKSRVGKKE